MAQEITLLVYPVKDVERAGKFYSQFLGVEPYVEGPYYVGFKTGELEIGLDPHSKSPAPIGYKDVKDIRSYLQDLVNAGAEVVEDIRDVGKGLLIAKVKDTEGNILGLRQSP